MGIDVTEVSRSMGHASVSFTMERYVGTDSTSRKLARQQAREWAKKER